MKPRAFVAMPFGRQCAADGRVIDFDALRDRLVRPALEAAGYVPWPADDEGREGAGDDADRIQALLVADLVVVDLTLANPSVWYQIGVRHALRACGVVLLRGPCASHPLDMQGEKTLHYRLQDGLPDAEHLERDRARLVEMIEATRPTSTPRHASPVFRLLDRLREPPWRHLLRAGDSDFAERLRRWEDRLEDARRRDLPGDMLVLADEAPIRALRVEARRAAGDVLLALGQPLFALEQFETALALDPSSLASRLKQVVALGRCGRFAQARRLAGRLLQDHPADAECLALAGRLAEDEWVDRWRGGGRRTATDTLALLHEAIDAYQRAFVADPSDHGAGNRALALLRLRAHLTGTADDDSGAQALAGGARWAALAARQRDPADRGACASVAQWQLSCGQAQDVAVGFAEAAAAVAGDRAALDAMRQTLQRLRELEFRPAQVDAALRVVQQHSDRLEQPFVPRRVFLFSGHMVDAPGRQAPRFPPAQVPRAKAAIERALAELGAGAGDLALTQGAAGGDLLFAEACLARTLKVQFMQPVREPTFVAESILRSSGGASWRARYEAVKARLPAPPRCAPQELGDPPPEVDAWERGNLWLLYTALAHGVDKLRCVLLWNGGGGDGPGGTRHMREAVERRAGHVTWLDTRTLFGP